MSRVGSASWLAAGFIVFLLCRFVKLRRQRAWVELSATVPTAFVAGICATALDFGGWSELEWRAALFALLCAVTVVALTRLSLYRA